MALLAVPRIPFITMTNDRTFPPHSSLAAGIKASSSRLIGLESELTTTLDHSEELASLLGAPANWDTGCHHQWDQIEDILDVIHGLVSEIHTAILQADKQGARQARAAWATIQEEEVKLADVLRGMRGHSGELDETTCVEWLEQVRIVEAHRKVVRTAAEGFGVSLEAWEAEISAASAHQMDQAAVEIEQEQHQVLDLKDHIKAMFMWVEAPEERVEKNTHAEPQAA